MIYILGIGETVEKILDFFRSIGSAISNFFKSVIEFLDAGKDVLAKTNELIQEAKDIIAPWITIVGNLIPSPLWIALGVAGAVILALIIYHLIRG